MRTLPILLLAAATACTTLPDPRLAPHGSETAATVEELGPGRYHILVRINYFAPDGEAERLLRKHAATLCGDGETLHIDHLATARQPAMAAAEITCEKPATAAANGEQAAAPTGPTAPPTDEK